MKSRILFVLPLVAGISLSATLLHAQDKYPVRQLTSDRAQEGFPFWSPDGKTIVYTITEMGEDSSKSGLWTIPAEGGEPQHFTTPICEHPNWSPDGHYIIFDADTGDAVKLISSHGGNHVRVVPALIPVYKGGNPIWSPDASGFAFKEGPRLWVADITTGEFKTIFTREGTRPIPCCWSRDGTYIIVWVLDGESRMSHHWKISTTGAEPQQLTFKDSTRYRYMDQSPDGSLLAYASSESGNLDLWVMPSEGGQPVQLTYHPRYDDAPRWSPDGTKIAFTSARTGGMDVYVMELDIQEIKKELKAANE
jgi:Tol biopolymer transport system component